MLSIILCLYTFDWSNPFCKADRIPMLAYIERLDNLPSSTARESLRDYPIDDDEDVNDSIHLQNLFLNGGKVCEGCGQFPCIWECNKDEFLDTLYSGRISREANVKGISNRIHRNKRMRNKSYMILSFMIDGRLGKDNRKSLPRCVVDNVRKLFPAPNGKYVGFQLSEAQKRRAEEQMKKGDKTVGVMKEEEV